ncbi:acyl-CoA reductase [Flavisolibacter tropicus]|uniref:Acyl-CoA reductase n=1 Tax=Flavisolibacter tropicus TaxID=1492898 RepID=A0A172TT17_9BACT|nr:acyl-CoA reductase [Flavisolibacter tropicus]ANE50225.1 acyl-CoA reductase [Flavisolibacter tropicus]
MQLQDRIALLVRLGEYMQGREEAWQSAKHKAFTENNWFIPEFIETAIRHISTAFLEEKALKNLAQTYQLEIQPVTAKKVGIVLPGTTPLAGFHDIVSVFLAGHYSLIKTSSRDEALLKHLIYKLQEWLPGDLPYFNLAPMLKGCDAYIATNSKESTTSFDQYFSKYQSIIRRNTTSVAVLTGQETTEELEKLADDIHLYFGLGSRNVTKLYVPENYDFVPLLNAFKKYEYFSNHHKFKNNYDYNLSIQILNNRFYMTNGSILLTENPARFSPISQVYYEFYSNVNSLISQLEKRDEIEGIVGLQHIPFGESNFPSLATFEKGTNTLTFLNNLSL